MTFKVGWRRPWTILLTTMGLLVLAGCSSSPSHSHGSAEPSPRANESATQRTTLKSVERLLKSSNLGVCHVSTDSGNPAAGSTADINLFLPKGCPDPSFYGPGVVLTSYRSAASAQAGANKLATINGFDPWILNNLLFYGEDITSGETQTFHA
ncbi:MAG TPA: hypothetical protein VG815_08115, partial [Chloroflexota bacterium]|nr:hypothetical protein [Chloroflexota bacterium]